MEALFLNILEITLPMSVCIALLLLCAPLLKRSYASKWRYFMWLLVCVRLLLPFRVHNPITMEIPPELAAGTVSSGAQTAAVSVGAIAAAVWIVGAAVCAVYQAVSYVRFSRMVRRWSKRADNSEVTAVFEREKAALGVKRSVEIKYCKVITTPMVFGLIKPVLLLPHTEFTQTELPIILRHELVHLRRNDVWYKLLLIAARTVHWFNPFAYMMVSAANRDIELACDDEVVRSEDAEFRRCYCETIMRLVHSGCGGKTALSTCFIFSKKTIMERFKNIVDVRLKKRGIASFVAVAVSVGVSGGIISFAAAESAEVSNEISNAVEAVEAQIHEYVQPLIRAEAVPEETPQSADADVDVPPSEKIAEPERELRTVKVKQTKREKQALEPKQTKPVVSEPVPESTASAPEVQTGGAVEAAQPSEAVTAESSVDVNRVTSRETAREQLGTPQSVSQDGSKETYNLSNGNKVVLRYDEDELDAGYILVD